MSSYPPEFAIRQQIVDDPEQQAIKRQRRCLDAGFLADAHDPWQLQTNDYHTISHRDATLGNGWLGIHVSPDGEASAYRQGSRHFCYGMRPEQPGKAGGTMRELPLFATLQCGDRRARHGRSMYEITDFHQTLDMQRARVETTRTISSVAGTVRVWHGIYLPLQHRGVVVIDMEMTPVSGRWWRLDETLSLADISDADGAECAIVETGQLELTAALGGHDIAIVSHVSGDGEWVVDAGTDTWVRHRDCELDGPLRVTKVVAIAGGEWSQDAIAEARQQVASVVADLAACRREHEAAWARRWQRSIEVPNAGLQVLTNASWFQLLSATRTDCPAGIPPCGLTGSNWSGSVFWDLDTWMQPPLDLFHPELGEALCAYRFNGLPHAKQRAAERGYAGADYPWVTATSGEAVSSAEVGELQRHVTAGVARAMWHHYLVCGDQTWLRNVAWPVFKATARYWVSRASDYAPGGKTIAGVRQPDEYGPIAECHATTNAAAAWNLRQASTVATIIGITPDPAWNQLADELVLPRDLHTGMILQWDAWSPERVIKQADASLLIHPWLVITDSTEQRQLLTYYGERYDRYLIMMSLAIDAIGWCRVGESERAWAIVEQCLEWFRPPYLRTSESPWNECMSFLTGLGGFLQVLINGFAGLRWDDHELVVAPRLPQRLPHITLTRITVGGVVVSMHITNETVCVIGDVGDAGKRPAIRAEGAQIVWE